MKFLDRVAGLVTGWLESADDAHEFEEDEE